jgi:hypothetical protein
LFEGERIELMRRMIVVVALGLLVVPAALAAGPSAGGQSGAQGQCAKLQVSMGAQAFGQAFASFGACVSRLAALDQGNTASARSACRAEQQDANFAAAHAGKTFDQVYGSGKQDRNAFGSCVAAKAQAAAAAEVAATPNPAQSCRAARTAMGGPAFVQLYGTTANKSNAFGKCVAKTAQAQTSSEATAASTCSSDPSVTGSADANAFGQCVAAKARAASAQQQQQTVNAAKTCVAELTSTGQAAFKGKYGSFGRCVSQHTK